LGKIFDALEKTAQQREKRKHSRIICMKSVDIDTDEFSYSNNIVNISPGGAFIETIDAITVGQKIEITILSKKHNRSFTISAEIVQRSQHGIGVKFEKLSQHQLEMINSLIEEI
jgi:hypothetical protein